MTVETDYFIIQLFKSGKIKNILISGGNGQLLNNGYMESEWSKDFLINCGIPEKNIQIENKSRNTWEILYTLLTYYMKIKIKNCY